jgi:uncharacterized protein (DUF1501 family)
MNRRDFIKSSAIAVAGTAFGFNAFGAAKSKTVVVLFQRGAVDGLNMIVPYGEGAYYAARPSIAIPKNDALDLDGFFGAHPSMQPLMPYWKDRSLAVVHAAGSPNATRSHFDAQDFMETGTPGVKSTQSGFLTRALDAKKTAKPLNAISITQSLPRIFAGSSVLATSDIARFANSRNSELLRVMYPQTYEAMRVLQTVKPSSASYPRGPLANSLRQIAQLIKANVGLELAFADVAGWDTHAGQGGKEGQFANNLRLFSEALAAFANDLGTRMSDVIVVTTSEFGRTVRENGNRGTDHGHGTVMLLLGGNVKGGKVHGAWPGLDVEQLFERRDLAVTTDFRDVFAEVLMKGLSVPSIDNVFPGYKAKRVGAITAA